MTPLKKALTSLSASSEKAISRLCHYDSWAPYSPYCPRAAPTQGIVPCTYEHCFNPYSPRRSCCQLSVSEWRMQRLLQFRLVCHGLPIAAGRLAGAGHVDRANRVCLARNCGAIGNEGI